MKLASFDLEIAKIVEGTDWQAKRPLGISCAMAMTNEPLPNDEGGDPWLLMWKGTPQLSTDGAAQIVRGLQWLVERGFTLVTVNGLGFDFAVLGEESGMVAECADLALNHHCDMMLMSLCQFGWPIGLDALADGAGVQGKLHNVTLKDGSQIDDMSGAKAPEMWAAGEHEAVLAYLNDDVRSTLETAQAAVSSGRLGWYSRKGRWWSVSLTGGRLPTAAECLTWPRPDTSWMSDPISPDTLAAWARVLQ